MEEITWILQDGNGVNHIIQERMSFIGSEDCEVLVKSEFVDRQHAVLCRDEGSNSFKIKDLGSKNGTFLNNICLPWQVYIAIKDGDTLKFGNDAKEYTVQRKVSKIATEPTLVTHSDRKKSSNTSASSSSSSRSSKCGAGKKAKSDERSHLSGNGSRAMDTESPSYVDPKIVPHGKEKASQSKKVNGSWVSANIEHEVINLNLSSENDGVRSKETEVEDWFSVNAPKKAVPKIQTLPSETKRSSHSSFRPGTPLATLDQIPPTHSPHYSPKPVSNATSILKAKEKSGLKLNEVASSKITSSESSASKKTYTIENSSEGKESTSSTSSNLQPSQMKNSLDEKESTPPEDIRSNWVSEWVMQHHRTNSHFITPNDEKPPSYQKCVSENMDETNNLRHFENCVASIDGESKKSRRSLPAIPKREKLGLSAESILGEIGSTNTLEHSTTSISSRNQVRHVKEKVHLDHKSTLQVKNMPHSSEKGEPHSTKFQEQIGSSEQVPFREELPNTTISKKSNHGTSEIETSSSSSSEVISKQHSRSNGLSKTTESGTSGKKKRLSRSGSFTKDKPSGVVPLDQIPVIKADIENPSGKQDYAGENLRLERNCFLEKFSSPSSTSNVSSHSISSLDTTLLFKDTDVVMSLINKRSQKRFSEKVTSTSSNILTIESNIENSSNISLSDGKSSEKTKSPRKVLGKKPAKTASQPAASVPPLRRQSKEKRFSANLQRTYQPNSNLVKSSASNSDEDDVKQQSTEVEKAISSSHGLKLNRATLLRKNKAKEMASSKPRRQTTVLMRNKGHGQSSLKSVEKGNNQERLTKLNESAQKRLFDLSKPSTLRTSRRGRIEVASPSARELLAKKQEILHCAKTEDPRLATRHYTVTSASTFSSKSFTDSMKSQRSWSPTTHNTEVSLGARIVKVATDMSNHEASSLTSGEIGSITDKLSYFDVDRSAGRATSPDSCKQHSQSEFKSAIREKSGHEAAFSQRLCLSENEDRIFSSYQVRSHEDSKSPSPTFDSRTNFRGSCSVQPEKLMLKCEPNQASSFSEHLAEDLEILSKPSDLNDTMSDSMISTTTSCKPSYHFYSSFYKNSSRSSPIDSLESLYACKESLSGNHLDPARPFHASVVESPLRRTWTMGTEPLDNLALSNALSLSRKLGKMGIRIQNKVRLSLKVPDGKTCHCDKCEESTSESKFSSNSSDVPLIQQTSTQEMASLINNLRYLECILKEVESHVDSGCPTPDPI